MPKIAFNAELAPKLVLLLVLVTLVICGVLTLVGLVVLSNTCKVLAHVVTLILSKHAAPAVLHLHMTQSESSSKSRPCTALQTLIASMHRLSGSTCKRHA